MGKGAKKQKTVGQKSKASKKPLSKKTDIYQYENDKPIRNYSERAGVDSEDDLSDDNLIEGDDESIDDDGEEVGWNSDDEFAYGKFFRGKSKTTEYDDSEEEDYDDDNQPLEGEILLSDLHDDVPQPHKVLPSEEASVDYGDDDDGFDYGDDDNDDDNDLEYEEQSDEGDEEDDDDVGSKDRHQRMIDAIEKFSKTDSKKVSKSYVSGNQGGVESAFSSVADTGTISLSTLLQPLAKSKDVSLLKQQLDDLESSTKVPKYVEKTVAQRIERSVTYDNSKEDMSKWHEFASVHKNSKTLDLAQDRRNMSSYKQLVNKFEPTTELEREVQMVLISSKKTEEDIAKAEEDELSAREFDPEEIKRRQAELAKVKALLFYEQLKRNRINKIKSKTYHRILKRKKQNAVKFGEPTDDNDNDNGEEDVTKHIKERMSLKHQNTGKWAKMALTYGKGNKSLRSAYHEAVQLGQELTKKIDDEIDINDNKSIDGYSSGEDVESGSAKAAKKLSAVLEDEQDVIIDGKYKKLFDMDFMKKAQETRRLQARHDANNILKELAEMERDSSSDESNSPKKSTFKKPVNSKAREDLSVVKEEMSKRVKADGSMIFKPAKSTSSTNEAVIVGAAFPQEVELPSNPWMNSSFLSERQKNEKNSQGKVLVSNRAEVSTISQKNENKKHSQEKGINGKVLDKTERLVIPLPRNAKTDISSVANGITIESKKKNAERKPLLMQKSQEDLVQMAFTGPDLEDEFLANKHRSVDDELGIDEKKIKILSQVKAGWGDWAGPGETGIAQSTLRKRDRMIKRVEAESAEKRSLRKDSKIYNVMISDRRIKSASKFKIAEIPHPFTSREEYEQSLRLPVGDEWNASHVVKKNTKPEVIKRAGRIIEPPSLAKKKQRIVQLAHHK